jgi:hypothetical protein
MLQPQVGWSTRWEREREVQEEAMAQRVPQVEVDAVEQPRRRDAE